MMVSSIHYREQTASREDIQTHLTACDGQFFPRLSSRVNLCDYSSKLFEQACTFEAWHEQSLAGLVAVYFQDTVDRSGFISNVSVLQAYSGEGLASGLMGRCTEKARKLGLRELRLEVATVNSPAIHLYRKFEFVECGRTSTNLTMQLMLSGTEDHEQ
jgi:ribosomal protein S18 acetylase RimI-like enzyme